MKNIFIFPIILFLSGPLMAISCTKSDPESLAPVPEEPDPGPVWDPETERGWYDAPYLRYEAESGSCVGNCTFLAPSDRISDLQSEASNDVAAQLVAQGDYVEWCCREAADELLISGCRMRNNYADGINICGSSRDCVVEHSDFRNNGDDNLASWSSATAFDGPTEHLVFRHCTSELGWRAAAIGIFGGRGHHLHNLLIRDQCESGLRMVTEFTGPGFADDEYITVDKVTIENCGVRSGAIGEYGTIGGGEASSLDLSSAGLYDLHHLKFSNLDIVNSQWNGITVTSNNRYTLREIYFENVRINGWQNLGLDFENAAGEAFYRNLVLENGNGPEQNEIPEGFTFTQF